MSLIGTCSDCGAGGVSLRYKPEVPVNEQSRRSICDRCRDFREEQATHYAPCEKCGDRVPSERAHSLDVTAEDQYYPEFIHFCPVCAPESKDDDEEEEADLMADGGQPADQGRAIHHGPMQQAEQDPSKNDYATPPELWRPLANAVDGFDVDPCSGAESTPIADTRYTKEDDGLRQSWHGDVFVNPPWSSNGTASAKEDWLRKIRNEANRPSVDSVTVLLPSDTSAGWFHEHVLAAPLVCFVGPGRISFVGADRNPSFGLLIPVYGDDADRLREPLTEFGAVVDGRGVHDPVPQSKLTEVCARE